MKVTQIVLASVLLLFSSPMLYGLNPSDAPDIELSGVVFAVDAAKSQIVIKITENGKPRNTLFRVTEDTAISNAEGGRIALEQVKMGDEVVVRFIKMKKKNFIRSLQVAS